MRRLSLAAFLTTLLLAAPLLAQDKPEQRLQSLEKELQTEQQQQRRLEKEAATLAADLDSVRNELVKAATAAQEYEGNLTALETRLAALEEQRQGLLDALGRRDLQIIRVLTALQRLAWRPSESLIVQPLPPTDAVRSAILLRTAVPQIKSSVNALQKELLALSALKGEIGAQRDRIAVVAGELAAQQINLETLFNKKKALQESATERSLQASQRVKQLASDAKDLKDLIDKLNAERRIREEKQRKALAARVASKIGSKPGPGKPAPRGTASLSPGDDDFAKTKGSLALPARGRIITRYGQKNNVGLSNKGVVLQTRSDARVVAPHGGTVVFSGPFRRYGQLLILEYSGGYHVLLAGMARIDAKAGQHVVAGEPVGIMGGADKPELYVELRRNGQPINPLSWMVAGKG